MGRELHGNGTYLSLDTASWFVVLATASKYGWKKEDNDFPMQFSPGYESCVHDKFSTRDARHLAQVLFRAAEDFKRTFIHGEPAEDDPFWIEKSLPIKLSLIEQVAAVALQGEFFVTD
jgi:hypothetical protein